MSEFIEKYPWLKSYSLFEDGTWGEYDIMDDMPEGWRIAFGDLLCEELDSVLRDSGLVEDFSVYQIKEKFGKLCMYVSHYTQEINDILDKYSAISKNVCIMCGRPDVSTMRSETWIAPYCEDCFYDRPFSYLDIYEDMKYAGDRNIRNNITVTRKDGNDYIAHKINLKDTADRIRSRWAEREIGRS